MKAALLGLLLLSPGLEAVQMAGKVSITEKKSSSGVLFTAKNHDPHAVWNAELSFPSIHGLELSRPRPIRLVLKPGESKEMVRATVKDAKRGWGYNIEFQATMGDPDARHDPKAEYLLPFEHGTKRVVGQGYFGATTHQSMRALDFDMPTGTRVCAARDGVVVNIKQDSNRGGPSAKYAYDSNFIEVMHADGTWASYAHLKLKGALVKLGQKVKAGDPIGLSGATGLAEGPHLHFAVEKARWKGAPETVETRFRLDEKKTELLKEGKHYYGWRPGGPAFERKSAENLDEAALSKPRPAPAGKLTLREEKIENAVLVYCVNGTSKDKLITLRFDQRQNAQSSKPLPLTVTVPARTEQLLTIIRFTGAKASYALGLSYAE